MDMNSYSVSTSVVTTMFQDQCPAEGGLYAVSRRGGGERERILLSAAWAATSILSPTTITPATILLLSSQLALHNWQYRYTFHLKRPYVSEIHDDGEETAPR